MKQKPASALPLSCRHLDVERVGRNRQTGGECPIYYPLSSSSSSASYLTSCVKWLQMDSFCLLAVLLLCFTLGRVSTGKYRTYSVWFALQQPHLKIKQQGGKHAHRAHLNCFYECAHKSDFSLRFCVNVCVQGVCVHFQRVLVLVSFSLTDQKVLSGLLSSTRESCSYKFRKHGWKHNQPHQSHSWFTH